MKDDLRIAIVGAGNLSTRRIYAYIGAAGAQLVGVCDLDAHKAECNARRFGGHPFRDMEEMLDTVNPDGVIVGSAIVRLIAEKASAGTDAVVQSVAAFVRELSEACRGVT